MAARWCGDWAPGLGWREHLPGSMWPTCSLHLHFFFNLHPRTCFLLIFGEGAWERNIDKRVRHRSVASPTHPNRGSNPQPGCVTGLGIKPTTFWCTRPCSSPGSRTGQGHSCTSQSLSRDAARLGCLLLSCPTGKTRWDLGGGERGLTCTAQPGQVRAGRRKRR